MNELCSISSTKSARFFFPNTKCSIFLREKVLDFAARKGARFCSEKVWSILYRVKCSILLREKVLDFVSRKKCSILFREKVLDFVSRKVLDFASRKGV